MNAWRNYTGQTAWPTVVLFALVVAAVLGSWAAVFALGVSVWLTTPILTVATYLAFTPMHEAAHGNIGGRKGRAFFDTGIGWACSVLFLAPYSAFKAIHLRHHGVVNQPEKDPDYFVAHDRFIIVLWRCFLTIPEYYRSFLFELPNGSPTMRAARRQTFAGAFVLAMCAMALVIAGRIDVLVGMCVVPAVLASGALALAFDWFPHHPHTDTHRFRNARLVPSGWLSVLMVGQNLHLIHHLWPKVPFYRYAAVWEEDRDALVEKGVPLQHLDWTATGLLRSHEDVERST